MYYIAYVCSLFYCVFVHKNHMGHIIMFASYLVLCMFHVSKITSIKKGVSFECMYIECTQASNAKKYVFTVPLILSLGRELRVCLSVGVQ